jgi:hypothetical protein
VKLAKYETGHDQENNGTKGLILQDNNIYGALGIIGWLFHQQIQQNIYQLWI